MPRGAPDPLGGVPQIAVDHADRPARPTNRLASRVRRSTPHKGLCTLGPEPPLHRKLEEATLAPRLPPVGAFAAAAAFTVTRLSATANDRRDRRVAKARVAVDRARPRLIRSPSQLATSAVVIRSSRQYADRTVVLSKKQRQRAELVDTYSLIRSGETNASACRVLGMGWNPTPNGAGSLSTLTARHVTTRPTGFRA